MLSDGIFGAFFRGEDEIFKARSFSPAMTPLQVVHFMVTASVGVLHYSGFILVYPCVWGLRLWID